ncbi:MAG: molecular chaperone DnaJ [Candidatus Peribacteraceae bacterium]|nr:molecular chaperone DnaJ [Candidatus Peribacteraceae bacterium]
MAKDYYSILGIERNASSSDVKKAYRKLSKELHPDKHKGEKEAEQKFKEVNEAYEVLSDPKKKQMYDQFGATGNQAGGGTGGFGGFDFSGFQGGGGDQNFGGFSDIFENFFGGAGGSRGGGRKSGKGEDIEVQITLDLLSLVKESKREISLDKFVECKKCRGKGAENGSGLKTCDDCKGTGQNIRTQQSFFGTIQQAVLCQTCMGSGKVPEKKCKSCNGEGRINERSTVELDIPAGMQDGQTLRIKGKGQAGRQGEEAGDLFVHVRVIPDSHFRREGNDIYSQASIPVIDALLGSKAKIDTVHGKVELNIPEGTQPQQVLRVKGKGMPIVNSSRIGDHYVTVKVEIPKKLSRKERGILEEWNRKIR